MFNDKYVSFDMVMERVMDNPLFSEIAYSDALEYAYQAMAKIGATITYIHKITDGNKEFNHPDPIEIVNFRAEIPYDVYNIEMIRDWDTKTPYIESAYVYHKSANTYTDAESRNSVGGEYTYTMNNNYIFTSLEEGFLELSYWSFPTDCDMKPLIPDNERYIQAIVRYIQMKEAEKLWIMEKLTEKKYQFFEQEWLFYVTSAFVDVNMPNYARAETLARNNTRVVKTPNSFMSSFLDINPQQRYVAHFRNRRWR